MRGEIRIWEVDFLRAIAVLMMLVSNFVFDLSLFSYMRTDGSFFWPILARVTAALFLLLVGVSLTLSYARAKKTGTLCFNKFFKRGASIFILGLLVSLATWWAVGDDLVVFGVLHLIGFSIVVSYPLIRYPSLALLAALLVFAGGWFVKLTMVSFPWLIWLGFQYAGFSSVDFTPVFPWLGFVLLGLFLGNRLFPGGQRVMEIRANPDGAIVSPILSIGRHSLLIYFVHQPIFWSGFWGWQNIFQ